MQKQSRRALVLSHVSFEDIGSLDVPLLERGFDIETVDVATACFPLQQAESCDLLVVLGGPIGVYDQQNYPFLKDEVACIGPTLGGAQADPRHLSGCTTHGCSSATLAFILANMVRR